MDDISLDVMLDELEEAAELEGSEQGEWWASLAALRSRVMDCASPEFEAAYAAEVRSQYSHLKENFRVVEETLTQTITTKRLECD